MTEADYSSKLNSTSFVGGGRSHIIFCTQLLATFAVPDSLPISANRAEAARRLDGSTLC